MFALIKKYRDQSAANFYLHSRINKQKICDSKRLLSRTLLFFNILNISVLNYLNFDHKYSDE